ncbi:MAG: putative dehydrogenase [Planctomycetota bacterium]|nr:putative dehydrogenase [Planctomycetota bacterium]
MRDSAETRRAFLEKGVGLVGASTLIGATAVESARGFAANDTIEIGCIGTGGRCQHLMKSLAQIPGVRIAAVCDVFEPNRENSRKLADKDAAVFKNYHELLARKDLDAVLIGAPDHWHVPMTVDACAAGKDVYVEKPLTHDLSEGARVIKAQNDHKRIVQVGMQQRSMPHIQKAKELIDAGRIGRVLKAHLTWNRNQTDRMARGGAGTLDPRLLDWKAFLGSARDQPFDEYRFRNWRWFWDFGGGLLTDLMVHWIDVVHWVLNLDHPSRATTIGNHFAAKDVWETPDTIQCLLQYPGEIQVYYEGTFSNARHGAMCEFMGTEGTLNLDRGGYQIFPERGKGKFEELILGSDPARGRDFYDKPDGERLHLTNWVESIRSRQKPNAPAEAGVGAASAAHLGNLAYRKAQVADWKD